MEELLAKADSSIHSFVQGEKVEAKLLWLGKKSATFDIGGKSEGVVVGSYFDEARNFLKDLSPGDKVVVEIVEPEAGDEGIVVSVGKAALSGIAGKNSDQVRYRC
jgi:ribosomal protein S1